MYYGSDQFYYVNTEPNHQFCRFLVNGHAQPLTFSYSGSLSKSSGKVAHLMDGLKDV